MAGFPPFLQPWATQSNGQKFHPTLSHRQLKGLRPLCDYPSHTHMLRARWGSQSIGLPKMPCPDPRTNECVVLHGKGDFADIIKLRTLKWMWGDYPGLAQWDQGNPRILKVEKGKQKRRSYWCNVRKTQPTIPGFTGGGRGHKPGNVGDLLNLKKGKKQIYTYGLELLEHKIWISARGSQGWPSNMQNCEMINLYHFMPLSPG